MKRILVVDDEPVILKSLQVNLRREGYDVDTAESGNVAMDKLANNDYDILLTDLMMEGMSGLELMAAAKEQTPRLEVIILTGYGDLRSAVEALRLGAADYLLKPCNNEELFLRISNCMEKREMRRKLAFYENILPLCSVCKKIRNDEGCEHGKGQWQTMEEYLKNKTGLEISHGMCPKCADALYGDQEWYKKDPRGK